MHLNSTDSQKAVISWIVNEIRKGYLAEEFMIAWHMGGFDIVGYKGKENIPEITRGGLDAFDRAGLVLSLPNFRYFSGSDIETSRNCTVLERAFLAVDNAFNLPEPTQGNQYSIGAVINTMMGGNLQAIGTADESEITQIINDPELMKAGIDSLCENLLKEVKDTFDLDDMAAYSQAVIELRENLLSSNPSSSVIKRLVSTLALLGDIEGTIGLMTRIWPHIHNLLIVAGLKIGEIMP